MTVTSAAVRKRYRVGLVGLNFGRHVAESQLLAGPGAPWFELAAVCDLDAARSRAAAERYGVRAAADYASLLADPSIDAIALFCGPNGRAALVEQAVAAGKPVITTKPFEFDPDAAARALRKAAAAGIAVQLNSPAPRLTDDQRVIMDWRARFDLGRVIAARCETYARYQEHADGTWYDDPARCPVAPIFRLGIYAINELIRLVGSPATVSVQHARIFTGRPTPDNAQLSIRFGNGALGSVLSSFCIGNGRAYPNTLVLHCERGTVWRNGCWEAGAAACDLRLACRDGEALRTERATVDGGLTMGGYDWPAFHAAVSGAPVPDCVSADDIVAGIRVVQAMARSEGSGREEAVAGSGRNPLSRGVALW